MKNPIIAHDFRDTYIHTILLTLTFFLQMTTDRSLGVVIWELFEFGAQPHRHLSDEEVLTFVIRERQITLAQPRLKLAHADYWSVFLMALTKWNYSFT